MKIVDISQNRWEVIQEIGNSLRDTGFVKIKGLPPELTKSILKAYAVCDDFFHLKTEEKLKYHTGDSLGYTTFGTEHAKGSDAHDLKEFFHVGERDNNFPNARFEAAMVPLHDYLRRQSIMILGFLETYCGVEPGLFRHPVNGGPSILRLLHYPASSNVPEGSIRAAAHEDINLITLLVGATKPGLQVLDRSDNWIPVPEASWDEIVVNVGDMLQNMSNGYFKSATHRVVNQDMGISRYSLPFFCHPRPMTDLSPLESIVRVTGGLPLYPKITAKEYLDQRLMEIGLKK